MNKRKQSWWLISLLFATLAGCGVVATAQVPTTTVSDTIYRADGTPAAGTVLISWNAFTTAGGSNIPTGSISVTLGSGGLLTVGLAPNAGATPMGSYYTAVYHLSDGTTSREFWVIPAPVAGAAPVKLAAIRNQVLPLSVAMQTVSKQYVDAAIANAASGFPLDTSPFVLKAGGTMTGPLALPADPVSANQAADKNYVDASISAVTTLHATSGTIDNVIIGATSPANGTFTTLRTSSGTPFSYSPFPGSIDLNNGNADSGPLRFQYGNNRNMGINVSNSGIPSTCTTSEGMRFIVNDGEVGGAVIGALDTSGNLCGFTGVRAGTFQEALTTPASSTAPCTTGQFTDDANFHYVCVASSVWKRAALSSF
jgi:hypothetical protein